MKIMNMIQLSATALIIAAVSFAGCKDDLVKVTGVSLDEQTLTLTVGGSGTLESTVAPDDAGNKTVEWTSSDERVVTQWRGDIKIGHLTCNKVTNFRMSDKLKKYKVTCNVMN